MATCMTAAEITGIEAVTPEIKTFTLVPQDRTLLAGIEPGAHIDVSAGGHLRQYSLCNGPEERDCFRIAVKKEPASRGGSRAMHEQLSVGDRVRISPPRNNFRLVAGASGTLLLAGGIGITPLLSMARHLQADSAPFRLLYFARSREQAAFVSELTTGAMGGNVSLYLGLDAEATEAALRSALSAPKAGTHLYACGPRPFLEAVRREAQGIWPPGSVHFEYFQAEIDDQEPRDRPFKVKLASSGAVYEVPPGKTILEVLAEHGVEVDVSCEQGICGTCLTGVLGGVPDHRDQLLSDDIREAGEIMALCVSRSKSDLLVLDL